MLVVRIIAASLALLLSSDRLATALDFNKGTCPSTFTVGLSYPNLPETTVCRQLQTYISRDSDRFRIEMVTNVDTTINFANSDARIMCSRMQSKLGQLRKAFTGSFTVLKAWAEYPDPNITDPGSLHYDGRSIRVSVGDSRRISEFLFKAATVVGFDWVEYTSRQYVRLSVIPTACLRNFDIVFVLDASGSIGSSNFQKVIKFLSDTTSYFSIAPNATKVGLVEYSTVSTKIFNLDGYRTLQSLQAAISRITYTQGWTATGLGLLDALDILNTSKPYGARPPSLGLPRIAVLITDGYSNRGPSVGTVAPMLKGAGISVYTVGVGSNPRESELETIANSPAAQYVYRIGSYADADGFVNLLSFTTCDTPACVNPGDDISGVVHGDDIIHYCSKCPAFSRNVTVYVKDVVGKCHLYASGKATNPGPLTNSSQLYRNESMDSDSRSLTVTVDDKVKTMYVGVVGYRTMSRFSMFVSDTLFGSMVYSISINDSSTGIVVFNASANLRTSIKSNTLRYNISSGNAYGDFVIDPVSGVVRVKGTLNAITKPLYSLVIVAQNVTMDCHRARLQLVVTVRRSALIAGNTTVVSIPENTPLNTPVALVTVLGGSGNVMYSIVAGNNQTAFAINSSGWISVSSRLNYQVQQNYTLTVRLTSTVTQATSTVAQVILVTDVNEAPYFTRCAATNSCVGQVYENLPSGSGVNVTVMSADPDFPYLANGMRFYTMQSGYPFAVSTSGVITTTELLDRERVSSYTFTVTVTDRGTPPLSAVTSVKVIVLDVNDNAPIIMGPAYLQAREDIPINTSLATYTATDADIGINAVIQFVLIPSVPPLLPFTINTNTGLLTLRSALSYQNAPTYNFRVVARNPDGLNNTNSSVNVTFKVIGVNNNAPVFVRAPYFTSVVENSAIGTVVNVSILATDADTGTNGIVRYAIVQGNLFNSFSLNATGGQLRISANIDREVIDRFVLVVRAYDLGTPSLSSTSTVNITVIDVNDNPPVFNPPSYSITVHESVPVGTLLVTVSATDKDQPGTPNSQFDYSIANPLFTVSPNGSVWLNGTFNYSISSRYSLVVVAKDHGVPPLNGTAPFSITVINDHPAVISGNRTVSILETAPIQSPVATYSLPGVGQFSILSGNGGNTFAINSLGVISLLQPLDFNAVPQYILAISFKDASTNTTSISYLTVIVLEVNKYAPVFHDPLSFFIEEEHPAGTLVGFINVTDADKGPLTSKVTLTLSGPLAPYFVLNASTGRLTTSMRLDREMLVGFFIPPTSAGTTSVLAQDAGTPPMQTSVTITIVLGDINDNYPNITDATLTVTIVEEVPYPLLIFDVSATDPDLGLNGTVRYSYTTVVGAAAAVGRFAFPDNATGLFMAVGRLDREQQEQYSFEVSAYDLGTPPLTTTVPRNLTLLDINDNAPTFSQLLYHQVVTDAIIWYNMVLVQVSATDPDKGSNGTVQFALSQDVLFIPESPYTPAALSIDSTSGVVTVLTTFTYGFQPQVNATIVATDLGTPPMSSSALLVVDVTSKPLFTGDCTGSVYENSPLGTYVSTCAAVAQGDVPPVVYSIQSVVTSGGSNGSAWAGLFAINSTTGYITVAAAIDREAFHDATGSDSLTLVVAASDSVDPPSTAMSVITILDVNDNVPVFTSDPYAEVLTDAAIGAYTTSLLTVMATDRDEGTNALVMYSVLSVDQSSYATNITIFGQDSAPLGEQLSSTTVVTVTFQSNCHLQTYAIDLYSGQVTATLLCAASATPPAANVTVGGALSLACVVLANTVQTYQWIQNGTAIAIGGNLATYGIAGATFSSGGQYGCTVTTAAGTLQSGLSFVTIQVPPTITVPPTSVAVNLGMDAQFMCAAIGIPSPSISWLKNGVPYQQGIAVLQLTSTQLSDQAIYTCVASNDAGSTQASANLTIIDNTSVVSALVTNVTNPGNGGTCHQFDITTFQAIISNATGLTTVPTNVSGSLLCDMNPCASSPCLNGGTCMPTNDSSGGYTCTCPVAYTGANCDQLINFCLPTNPCLNGGTCTTLVGTYQCSCPPGIAGEMCQYTDICDSLPCNVTEFCIPTLGSGAGYVCAERVGIEGTLLLVDPTLGGGGIIGIDNSLAQFAQTMSTTAGRRRQQAQDPALLQCESRFIHLNGTPDSTLSLLKLVKSCYSPSAGLQYPAPPPSALGGTNVGISFVLLSSSGVPSPPKRALAILTSSGAITLLQQSGFKASAFMPLVSSSSPSPASSSGGLGTGAIVGAVVGALVGGLLLAVIVVLLISLVVITRRRREAIQASRTNEGGYVINLASVYEWQYEQSCGVQSQPVNDDGNEYDDPSRHATPYELASPSAPPSVPPKPVETPFIAGRESGAYENVVKSAAV